MAKILFCVLLLLHSSAALADAESTDALALKYPVVLIHGATMKGARLQIGIDLGDYFQRLANHLKKVGVNELEIVELPTDASIEERAAVLKTILINKYYGRMINLIGHSLGGLDARYLATSLEYSRIASITTIGTPHHGSPLASWAIKQIQNKGFWYSLFRTFDYDMAGRRFLPELTPEFMREKFNPMVPNRLDIKYYSVVTHANFFDGSLSPVLWFPLMWLRSQSSPMSSEPNDGMVPASSQEWGEVIVRTKLDHLGQINHHTLRFPQENASKNIYSAIVERLRQDGF